MNLWDHAAGGLVAQGAGAVVEVTTGVGGGRLVLCAPADGFDELRDAVAAAGYLAPGADGNSRLSPMFTSRASDRRCVATAGDGAQSGAPTASDRRRRSPVANDSPADQQVPTACRSREE